MILTVVGARPQFIKAAVVSRALARLGTPECVVHTGQHYDDRMSALFWRELGLPGIAANLAVGSGAHGAQTGQMMERLEAFVLERRASLRGLLVYGDTNSTLAGALVAAKLGLPIFHVEAGLRSFDRAMPEEVNRVLTDRVASLLFCPSENARQLLQREGITAGVSVVGDVMLDALEAFGPAAQALPEASVRWGRGDHRRALLTVHRPANTDAPARLSAWLRALGELPVDVLWPVHPRLRGALDLSTLPPNVTATGPLSYLETLRALSLADVVLTDSGGLQKEAYWSRRPCLTLRSETEWVETLEGGWNRLVGLDIDALERALAEVPRAPWRPLYGDGRAAERIAQQVSAHG